jgi:hypothetical protein
MVFYRFDELSRLENQFFLLLLDVVNWSCFDPVFPVRSYLLDCDYT